MERNIRKQGIQGELDDLQALSHSQHQLLQASIQSMSDMYTSSVHLCKAERSAFISHIGQIKRCLVEIDLLEERYRRVENTDLLKRLADASDISLDVDT